MRSAKIILALIGSLTISSAAAQGWFEFVDHEELFGVNLPQQPTVEEFTYESEFHAHLRGKKYAASDGQVDYSVIVVDYAPTTTMGERAKWEYFGSVAFAAWNIRRRGGEITYDGWAQADRIPGHQLQMTNVDGTRSYIEIHSHGTRLYILEAVAPADLTPPIHFQQSLIILDEDGEIVRYDTDLRTRVDAGR
jgi:hypothetical protein